MKLNKLDLETMSDGVIVDLGDDSSVTIRSTGCKAYKDYVQGRYSKYATILKIMSKKAANDLFEDIATDALVEILLIDWEGIKDENDQAITYSKEKAKELFSDPAYAEFKDLVSGLAAENETFRPVVEAVVKN